MDIDAKHGGNGRVLIEVYGRTAYLSYHEASSLAHRLLAAAEEARQYDDDLRRRYFEARQGK